MQIPSTVCSLLVSRVRVTEDRWPRDPGPGQHACSSANRIPDWDMRARENMSPRPGSCPAGSRSGGSAVALVSASRAGRRCETSRPEGSSPPQRWWSSVATGLPGLASSPMEVAGTVEHLSPSTATLSAQSPQPASLSLQFLRPLRHLFGRAVGARGDLGLLMR